MAISDQTENFKKKDLLRPLNSADDLKTIHQASLDLLENGIQVKSEAALEIFHSHGCRVEKRSGLVKIPPHVVESAIQSTPSQFLLAGRKPEKDVLIHGDNTHFTALSGATNYLDPKNQTQRLPTKKDLINCIKLIDASD